ncbi:MAG TPA: TonB-dependent receptor [Puia sp.]|nr:TonB-dependent receptor [Puia sp.]
MAKGTVCRLAIYSLFISTAAAAQPHPRDSLAHRDSLPQATVTGYTDNGSDKNALQIQRLSGKIVDIVSAGNIAQSSDLSVADVTRRVNGLSVTMDHSGQSDLTIIRGIDPKYNYTLVDGIKIPSPGDRSRYVSLAIFPSGLAERIEVYKSLTPDMEGDAIGGVVNLVTRDAPKEQILQLRLSSGYNQELIGQPYLTFDSHAVLKESPYQLHGPGYAATGNDFTKANLYFADHEPAPDLMGSLTWGRRYFSDKFGVLVAGDYQSVKSAVNSFFIPQNNEPQLNNAPGLTDFYLDRYNATIIRKGLHAKLDFTLNPQNNIELYQFYATQEDIESRHRVDTSLDEGRSEPGTGRITVLDRSRLHFQDLYSASLRGTHRPARALTIRWTLAYAVATGLYPDWAELSAGTAAIEQPNGTIAQSPLLLDPLTRIWLRNREQDLSGYLHADYQLILKGRELILSAGGLYRAKDRDNFYNSYTFQPAITGTEGQPFIDIYHATWTDNNGPQDPYGAVANSNTYTAHEDIGAGYASLSLKGKRAEWLAGLRYENTYQQFVSSIDPSLSYGKEGSITYADLLPSAHLTYNLGTKQLLRAAWYQSLSRPALYDVTFYSVTYEDYVEAGNPFLQRSRANNADLRYEWYPGGQDLLEGGVFFKHIADPYEKTLLNAGDELYPLPSQGLSYTPAGELTAQMRNAPAATDYGLELAATKYFGRFGIQAAYTYTYSSITVQDKFVTRQNPNDPSSNLVTISRRETRPLQGQSRNLANASLVYNDTRNGWLARVTGIYTGRRIYSVSGWYGLDYWERGYTVLDASLEKKLGRHFKAFLKAANLFNTTTAVDLLIPNPEFSSKFIPGQQSPDRITVSRQIDKASYYAGLEWGLP